MRFRADQMPKGINTVKIITGGLELRFRTPVHTVAYGAREERRRNAKVAVKILLEDMIGLVYPGSITI